MIHATSIFLGPPDPPTNCSVLNQTTDSLEVQCLPGFNGGLQQSFLLEVTDIQTKVLLANATDKIPEFTVISYLYRFFKISNRNLYVDVEMFNDINTHVLGIWIKLWAWTENYVVRC